jgi:transcription-repair coupling factor (superfamily II helicase)
MSSSTIARPSTPAAGSATGSPSPATPTLAPLVDLLAAEPALARALESWREGTEQTRDLTGPAGLRPFLAAALAAAGRTPLVIVTATSREGEDLEAALHSVLRADRVALYPSWETLPHERLSPRSDTVGRRLGVLRRLVHPETDAAPGSGEGPLDIVIAPIRSILQPQVAGLAELKPVILRVGDEIGLDALVESLAAAAYSRVDLVSRRGEFAVRGGIVDVFPPTGEHPLRVDFFGDEVEDIRLFAVADQRSLGPVDRLWAPPCRELLLTDSVRAKAKALLTTHPELSDMLARVAEGIAVEGMESLIPVLVDSLEMFLDVLPARCGVLVLDPERIRTRAHDLVSTSREFLEASWTTAAAGGSAPVDLGATAYRDLGDVRHAALAAGRPWWTLSPLSAGPEEDTPDIHGVDSYRGDAPRAAAEIGAAVRDGWTAVVVAAGPGSAKHLARVFSEADTPARVVETTGTVKPGVVTVTTGALTGGIRAPGQRLVVFGEDDLTGRATSTGSTKDMRRMPSRRRNQVNPLDLSPGDHVVHDSHGVGRYVEMIERTVGGATREYLVVEYAPGRKGQPGDRLFVPTDSLDQLTRYVGGESPTLDKMGGADWSKRKGRARKAVKAIAGELIRLYAARTHTVGHAFGPDTPWQRELEDAFPYVETPDQLACIDEVKADMERVTPMDRLICGDVGYGKTEIAVRAAFKAVQDGKQVAVLVPTTLLVQQHMQTFGDRYSGFPIRVRPLSRFSTETDSRAVLAGMKDGSVDIVIGTHRLLSAEVGFKDLGLVIVDEEQRFGVEHKETLKRLRTSVDVLTMSATPIPRTLEMAVTGIREMSTITTPPEERHPVLTYVGGYDDKQVAASIRRELLRDGQVFFVHNKVVDIERVAARIAELVPEARVSIGHGQMGEGRLEQVIVDFWERRADVLVCTTIVESGLDIQNANTLIVDRADLMGLSQLHQLRGRVGRGRERAYAYFCFPTDRPMTETAHDRLATIAQHSELGSGAAVAMKDLEIRGAGNLLGGEQAGHIADVGFDLYIRMVGEAVTAYRDGESDTEAESTEVRVELPVDAHLPAEYLTAERLRLEVYRRLAEARTGADIDGLAEELTDRYGDWPEPVANLFAVARFRAHARRAGLRDVTVAGRQIRFAPVTLPESARMRLTRLHPGTLIKEATRTILVPRPTTAAVGGEPLRDLALLDWASRLVSDVLGVPAVEPESTGEAASSPR